MKEGLSQQLADFRITLLWIVPCIILYSMLILLVGVFHYFSTENDHSYLLVVRFYQQIHTLFSYLLTVALTFTISIRWKQPRPPLILLSIFYLGLFQYFIPEHPQGMAMQYLIAIITPFYTIPLITWLQSLSFFRSPQSKHLSGVFSEVMALIIPAFITMLLVLLVHDSLLNIWDAISPPTVEYEDLKTHPYLYSNLISVISAISHFLGLHSFYTLSFLNEGLYQATTENVMSYMQGNTDFVALNHTAIGVFSRLGGAGSTFSLIIAILLFSKEKSLRIIALLSIPPGFFNINEPLIFGIPVILNPALFFPFLIVPILNISLTLFLTNAGWVHPTVVSVPYISPLFANAYIATDGDWYAVLLQLVNIGIGTLVYLPFVKRLSHSYRTRSIYFSRFDTYYQRKEEEAQILTKDLVSYLSQSKKEHRQLEKELTRLSSAEFYLEYQPQVSLIDPGVVGAEALIRVRDSENKIYQPASFLPWLEKAEMMTDLDLWVFNQVIRDARMMKDTGVDIRTGVNISIDTLLDDDAVTTIRQLLESSGVADRIDIEITEKSLLQDEHIIADIFKKFQSLGVRIHLDDFGTGYSSLSYLPKFNLDEIKIDRSFLQNIHQPKARSLFLSLFDIAHSQKLGVIVEGVETREQLSLIPKQPDILVQGWYYSDSLEISEFIEYYQSFRSLVPKHPQDS
ncbi:Cyclic di-GMP phosphodiesterase Gmr [Vibrio aerogenes CECT 7868]|uniref:Cyclic di-GMP phosphodiesterase Gmr n=2 Tax=Vibrio aerogenes TaxID=92172 RepID=A0A1M5VV52_9VIBR|nr:Cyclic di-GMP phosphodiesterase Gmr [Vibrio aerogenes CECT 7868]